MTNAHRAGLYVIVNTKSDDHYYGSTSHRLGARWRQHVSGLKRGRHPNARLQSAWEKYGEAAFEFRVLAVLEPGQAIETEQRLLDLRWGSDDCYNMSRDASSPQRGRKRSSEAIGKTVRKTTGLKRSPEFSARQSEQRKGQTPHANTRAAVAENNRRRTGKALSAQHRANIVAGLVGRKMLPEQVEKMAASKRGKKQSPETVAKRKAWWAAHPEKRAQFSAQFTKKQGVA